MIGVTASDRGHRFRSGSPLTNYPRATPTPFINQLRYNFPRSRVIVIGIDDQWQDWWTLVLWHILTRDTNFYLPTLMYFRNLLGSYHLKTKRENLWSTVYSNLEYQQIPRKATY